MSLLRPRPVNDSISTYRPLRRDENLVITEKSAELLVYDTGRHHMHHLSATHAAIWRLSDGTRTVRQISHETGTDIHSTRLVLRQLDDLALLALTLPSAVRGTETRRQVLKKLGLAAIPAIVSITAPLAKAAASDHSPIAQCEPYGFCELASQCCVPSPDQNGHIPTVYCDGGRCYWG